MTETVSVSISGIAFSFVSYENVKCDSNQEGLLLGEFVSKETNHVTDAEHTVVNKQNIIKVKSVIPCPRQFYFYNAAGLVDITKLNNILGTQKDKVVGWYLFKQKQVSPPKLTIREKIVHKHLAALLKIPLSTFTTCLLTMHSSNIKATYLFSQVFLRYHMAKYECVPLHVENLTLPKYSYKIPEPMPNILAKVIKGIAKDNLESHEFVEKIQEGLQGHMNILLEELIEKEQQLFTLEEDVKKLRREITLNNGDKPNNSIEINCNVDGECSITDSSQVSDTLQENNKRRKEKVRKNFSPATPTKYSTRSVINAGNNEENTLHVKEVSYSSVTKRQNSHKK